ncbi:MAG TPA: anti-sigma factor [Solirubrobacterales bacterium]|nr:anti-sigma factor [Solirubrobacterales bacterium]
MTTNDHSRWSEDLAAYLLGALEPGEAAALERHLEGCERCCEEMRWLRPAVHSLPESVERQQPPRSLRESLMAEVRAEAAPASAEPRRFRPRRWPLKPAVGFAAIALLVAGVVGYEVGRDGSGESGGETVVSRQASGVTVKMVSEGGGGTLHLSNVDQLPQDRVLEAWVLREGEVEAVPALFVPDRHGEAETTIADMSGVEEVMVTREPRGGSEAPTSKPIVAMAVPG